MTCLHPLRAWRLTGRRSDSGKSIVVFQDPNRPSERIELPCGQCVGCRLERSRDWALRCIHEASLYDENCMVTLTYNDEHLPEHGTLLKKHHQDFMKRLRKRFPIKKIRYFMCGEYGDKDERPHYHFLLFNHDFSDKVVWRTADCGDTVWRSVELEGGRDEKGKEVAALWPYGFSEIGTVTWKSAAYVARYIFKKVNGARGLDRYVSDVDPETGECHFREPEYIAMSRGGSGIGAGGIGSGWFRRFGDDCRKDFLTNDGLTFRVPRYYDMGMEARDPDHYERVKLKRKEVACERAVTRERLRDIERVTLAKLKKLQRSL